MSNRVGICPVCETKQRTRWMKGVVRVIAWHQDGPAVGSANGGRCDGVDQLPLPTAPQKRRTSSRIKACDPFRAHAAVALDAWIEGKPYPAVDIDILCRVACHEYAFRNERSPSAVATLRADMVNPGATTSRLWDAYCTFCGVMRYQKLRELDYTNGADWFGRLCRSDRHAVECALKHLAFALEPAAPNVRRLPDEYLNDDTAPLLGGPTR